MGAEKAHLAGGLDLMEAVENRGSHAALVVLVHAVNIEEFQAVPTGRGGLLLQSPEIELVLAAPVNIERFVLGNVRVSVRIAFFPSAIGSAARGVYKRDLLFGAPLPKLLRVIGVHLPHISLIMIACIGTGAQMDDGGDVLEFGKFIEKFFAVDERQVFQTLNAAPSLGVFGFIDQDHVFLALVQKRVGR